MGFHGLGNSTQKILCALGLVLLNWFLWIPPEHWHSLFPSNNLATVELLHLILNTHHGHWGWSGAKGHFWVMTMCYSQWEMTAQQWGGSGPERTSSLVPFVEPLYLGLVLIPLEQFSDLQGSEVLQLGQSRGSPNTSLSFCKRRNPHLICMGVF